MNINDLFLLGSDGKPSKKSQPTVTKVLKKLYKKDHGKPKKWSLDVKESYEESRTKAKNLDAYTIRAIRSILKKKK